MGLETKKIRQIILAEAFTIIQFYIHFMYLASFTEPDLKVYSICINIASKK